MSADPVQLLEVAAVDAVADRGTGMVVAAVDPCSPFRDGIPCRDGSPCCKLYVQSISVIRPPGYRAKPVIGPMLHSPNLHILGFNWI